MQQVVLLIIFGQNLNVPENKHFYNYKYPQLNLIFENLKILVLTLTLTLQNVWFINTVKELFDPIWLTYTDITHSELVRSWPYYVEYLGWFLL